MFKSICKLLVVWGIFSIISTTGVSQHREIPTESNRLNRQMLPPDRHISNTAIIKYETIFADEAALADWTIINQDGSSNLSGETVGKFVTGLVFPGGGSVSPQVPGTYFWASNFANANGILMDEWLISPQLPVVLPGDTLSFFGGAPEVLFKDSIEVRLATSDPQGEINTFVHKLARFKMDGPRGSWTEYRVPLDSSIFIGSNIWIALRYWHSNGGAFGNSTDNVWLDHVTITGNNLVFSQNISAGWRLVGLPVAVSDSSVNTLYPNHTGGTLFGFDGGYRNETHLARFAGYWLNFPGAETVDITGAPFSECTIDLANGWNLISGPTCAVPLSAIDDPDGIIIAGTIYGYENGYFSADSLKAGQGYWVRTRGAGQISISCDF